VDREEEQNTFMVVVANEAPSGGMKRLHSPNNFNSSYINEM